MFENKFSDLIDLLTVFTKMRTIGNNKSDTRFDRKLSVKAPFYLPTHKNMYVFVIIMLTYKAQ